MNKTIKGSMAAVNLLAHNLELAELRAWALPDMTRLMVVWLNEKMRGAAPLEVCDVCGCAHHSWLGATCNSCRAGIQAAESRLRSERLRRACKTPIIISPTREDSAIYQAFMADPAETPWVSFPGGQVDEDGAVILQALQGPWQRPRFDFFASGLMHQTFGGRATRPEPRAKRDRRNRGPEQHGKWWQKGRRW